MASSKLKIDIRRQKIMELVRRDGKVLVSKLSEDLGATPVTIRNDLDALEREGYLVRVQGGAIRSEQNSRDSHGAIRFTSSTNAKYKQAIASKVSAMVSDGDTLFINSGTTTAFVASALHAHLNLKIVTNSLEVAVSLGSVPTFQVMLLGGNINPQYGFTSGNDSVEQLKRYRADWAVLAVDGCSREGGITTYHSDEALLSATMIQRSRHTLIVADHTKIGYTGFAHICDADGSVTLVTDRLADEVAVASMEKCGITVITA